MDRDPQQVTENHASTRWASYDRAQSLRSVPAIELPKGGGAVRGIDEKVSANTATGAAEIAIPLPLTSGRAGFGPELELGYSSGAGASEFGLGWTLRMASIGRKTARGLPRYRDADTFILSDSEDLVPFLEPAGNGTWQRIQPRTRRLGGRDYHVEFFRPRIEGGFSQIERWSAVDDRAECFWRTISGDNATRWYGRTEESRIFDPNDPARIFRWLICEAHDDRGQVIRYGYKAEDSAGLSPPPVNEANRTATARSAMRYLKRIRYANTAPHTPSMDAEVPDTLPEQFHFELVFDYGDHDLAAPTPNDPGTWDLRPDPFVTGRPGFELVTYRLCRRILMFHHFSEEGGVGADCLVRALELGHTAATAGGYSLLTALRAVSFRRAGTGYDRHEAPTTQFDYSEGAVATAPGSIGKLPAGLADAAAEWTDPDANALGGALTQVQGAWYLRPNLGPGSGPPDATGTADWRGLGPVQALADLPSGAAEPGAGQLLDLGAEGRMGFAEFDGPAPGVSIRTGGEWQPQTPFRGLPNIDYSDPDLRRIDLTGDGLADLLLTRDHVYTWYPSRGTAGFGPPEVVVQAIDENTGPRPVLSEADQMVFLADMTGDGLSDLVRICNGAVRYWPNLGYGRFGACVTMADAPWFDTPEGFDPSWLRLADVDGSGLADILYIGAAGTALWTNVSGNGWSAGRRLTAAPSRDSETQIELLDLFGSGTACLVWSSPLPSDQSRALRYLDLTGGIKPHLLTRIDNGIGGETHLAYAPSTRFQAEDAAAGQPWITTLPFVVHCLHRVETRDRITHNRFVNEHSYHHGYYDPVEREFAGFARTDSLDKEAVGVLSQEDPLAAGGAEALATSRPPVLVRQWHHTGAAFQPTGIVAQLEAEMWQEAGGGDAGLRLSDTALPQELDASETREAARTLRGSVLRREVYALDGTEAAETPYSVTESRAQLDLVQPRGPNEHAVFLVTPGESLSHAYERNSTDPRVNHELTLAVDAFGNVLRSAQVAYGRRAPDPTLATADAARQQITSVVISEAVFTGPIFDLDIRRLPLPSAGASHELTGVPPPPNGRYAATDLNAAFDTAPRLAPETLPPGTPALRLLSRSETLYRRDDLAGPLPLHVAEPMALPFESYTLAFTDAQLAGVFGDRLEADAEALLSSEGGYVRRIGSMANAWWIPGGRSYFSPDPDAGPATELSAAREAFFMVQRTEDPFGARSLVRYDSYSLLPVETEDALGNRITAGDRGADGTATPNIDYRLMAPRRVTDANGDRTDAAFDVAGRVAATARLGRPGDDTGESLVGLETDPGQDTLDAFLADPTGPLGATLIGDAATRSLYDDSRFARSGLPAVTASLTRQRRTDDDADPLQIAVTHVDGFGRAAQTKTLAAPGPVGPENPAIATRWLSDGWTVLNAKGDPVRRWEPFYSRTSAFEPALETGVSSVLLYDALGRLRGTLNPDRSWQKTDITPWRTIRHSANDLVLDPAKADPVLGPDVLLLPEALHSPSWHALRTEPAQAVAFAERFPDAADRAEETAAAAKAAALARTPPVGHLDTLGRVFLARAEDGDGEVLETRTLPDVTGLTLATADARGNTVAHHLPVSAAGVMLRGHDAAGRALFGHEMDEGETRILPGVDGQPLRIWTSRGDRLRMTYDVLRRKTHLHLRSGDGPEHLVERLIYGERHPDPAARLRTRLHHRYDSGGEETALSYDFMGNLLGSERRLRRGYAGLQDWAALDGLENPDAIREAALPLLDADVFASSSVFDLQGRPVERTEPDGRRTGMHYDVAGALARVEVQPRGTGPFRTMLAAISYNARGQREAATYAMTDGGTINVQQIYDPETWRLRRLTVTRSADGRELQDLRYTYDADGHVTAIRDSGQQTVFFANAVVEPRMDYTYDPLGRLIEASGREHAASNMVQRDAAPGEPMIGVPFANDGTALQTYIERYSYDAVGNILSLRHHSGGQPRWRRCYQYAEDSNRLLATSAPGETGAEASCPAPHVALPSLSARYAYDIAGCMASMPHLPTMLWNYRSQLIAAARQMVNEGTPETTHYVYDAAGARLRKVTDSAAAPGVDPVRRRERVSLGAWERYREFGADGETVTLERLTLHVADASGRVALIETQTVENGAPVVAEQPQTRFQFGNHLGSAVLELDDFAAVVAYEEFHPFGSTAYLGGRSLAEVQARRFRYIGREHDEESGLSHHGLRYYARWIARWISPDPLGTGDGLNRYRYAGNDPVGARDGTGLASEARIIRVSQDPDVTIRRQRESYARDLYQYNQAKQDFAREREGLSAEVQAAIQSNLNYAARELQAQYRSLLVDIRNLDAARAAYREALAQTQREQAEIENVKRIFRNAEGFVNRAALFAGVSFGGAFLAPVLPGGFLGASLGGGIEGGVFAGGEEAITQAERGKGFHGGDIAAATGKGAAVSAAFGGGLAWLGRLFRYSSTKTSNLVNDPRFQPGPSSSGASNVKGTVGEATVQGQFGTRPVPEHLLPEIPSGTGATFRRLDAPIGKDRILLQIKNTRDIGRRDLEQLVDTIDEARRINGTVDLIISYEARLIKNRRSPDLQQLQDQIIEAIDDGVLNVMRNPFF